MHPAWAMWLAGMLGMFLKEGEGDSRRDTCDDG